MSNKSFDFEIAKKKYLELGNNNSFKKMILEGKSRQVLEPFLKKWYENLPKKPSETKTVQKLHTEQDPVLQELDKIWKPLYKKAANLKPKLLYMNLEDRILAIKEIKECHRKCFEVWNKKAFYRKYGKLPNYEAQKLPDNLYELKQRLLTLRTYLVPSRNIPEEKKAKYMQEKVGIEAKIKLLENAD